jgi:hypothetical protein
MHVVGARFADLESALAAMGDIRGRVQVGPDELGVRALGSTRYEEPAWGFVLAGRFAAAVVDAVVAIVEGYGGTLLTHYVERPHPSLARVNGVIGGQGSGAGRDQPGRAGERSPSSPHRAPGARGSMRPVLKRWRRPAALLRGRAARITDRASDAVSRSRDRGTGSDSD